MSAWSRRRTSSSSAPACRAPAWPSTWRGAGRGTGRWSGRTSLRGDRPLVGLRADALRPRERGAPRVGLVPLLPRLAGRMVEPVTAASCGRASCSVMPEALADNLRANVAMLQGLGIPTQVVEPAEVARLVPGVVIDDIAVGGVRAGVRVRRSVGYGGGLPGRGATARRRASHPGLPRAGILVDGDARDRRRRPIAGDFAAPIVVDVAGAWAADSPGPSAWRCRSSRGATTRPTSASRGSRAPTSRS